MSKYEERNYEKSDNEDVKVYMEMEENRIFSEVQIKRSGIKEKYGQFALTAQVLNSGSNQQVLQFYLLPSYANYSPPLSTDFIIFLKWKTSL